MAGQVRGPDALIEVAWRGRTCRFAAKLRRDAKPLTLQAAIEQVRGSVDATGTTRPMIVAPYFSREKLDQLLEAGISAIDFSGNAVIDVPGKFLFYKTGNPNKYPESTPIRSAYRGNGSLVARVLLLEGEFQAVGAIREAIRSRGGGLTLGMISKVLQRLEADLAIERPSRNAVRVLQPERLLAGLLEAYQPPRTQSTWMGKVSVPIDSLLVVGGRLSSGQAFAMKVQVPDPFNYLLMKLTAYRDRRDDPDKDLGRHRALDVFRIVAMLTEPELDRVNANLQVFASDAQVRSSVTLVRTEFASHTARGVLAMREHQLWRNNSQLPAFLETLLGLMS